MQSTLVAGDTLAYTVTLADYPASAGWVLNYRLTPRAAGTAYTFSASASGDAQSVALAPAVTANWVAGAYTLSAWVTGAAGQRYTVSSECGQIVIAPDPASLAAGTDTRSTAEIALANVKAMLQGKGANGVERYAINGRELRTYPVQDLIRLKQYLEAEVNRERAAAGQAIAGGGIQRLRVRFGAPTQ